jgi:YbbR domain-containing protein
VKFLTQHAGWKLFSLAAAFVVWMSVASEPELATIVSVPVEYSNFPADLEISSDILETIDVEARGPAGQLRSLADSRTAAVVNFASVRVPGERTFTLTTNELKLPRGIELIRTIPAQLRYTFEQRETRAVPVEVPFSGKLAPGLSIAQIDIQPPQLRIVGPASRVRAAKSLTADPFDLTHVNVEAQGTLAVYASEPQVRFIGTPQVTVKIRVAGRRR